MSKKILDFLNNTDIPFSVISKNSGVSRNTLYNWLNNQPIREKNKNNFIEYINTTIKVETEDKEDKLHIKANYIIDLQKEKIKRLEDDLIKHKSTPVQQSVWTNLDYDYECEVKLTFENFTMGRTILSITNKEIQSKVLGYSVSEIEKLWDIGTLYKKSNQHPIDAILHKSTIKNIAKQIKSLPTLFESLKNMMGNHYIPQPLTYVCKDKSFVNGIAYNKVNWRDKTVNSRIKFLLND